MYGWNNEVFLPSILAKGHGAVSRKQLRDLLGINSLDWALNYCLLVFRQQELAIT